MGDIAKLWTRRVSIAFFVAVAIVAILFLSLLVLMELDIYFNETVGREARRRLYSEAAPEDPTKPKSDENLETQ